TLMVIGALVAVGVAVTAASDDTVRTDTAADAGVPVGRATSPLPPRVELQLAAGWQVLLADGELLVVATQPLGGRDLALAALARDDAVFSDFPADGVALAAGADRFVAKYTVDPTQVTRTTSLEGGVGGESVELGEVSSGPEAAGTGPGPARAWARPPTSPAGSGCGGATCPSPP